MSIWRPTQTKRAAFFVASDLILSLFSFYASYLLRFNFDVPPFFLSHFALLFGVLFILKIVFFALFNIYKTPWRFFSVDNLIALFKAHVVVYIIFGSFFLWFDENRYLLPRSVIFIDFLFSIFLLGALRISKRIYLSSKTKSQKPTLIVGATNDGITITNHLKNATAGYYPVAFIDNDASKIGTVILGLPVVSEANLPRLIEKDDAYSALIAKKYPPKELNALYERLRAAGITEIKRVTLLERQTDVRELSIEELLAREPKDLDSEEIARFIAQKTVLITGAGGSIGSEIARQCARYGAAKIILVDHSEFNLYKITEELKRFCIVSSLTSVLEKQEFASLVKIHQPNIVIHAAAYKHVPLAEANIDRVIKNNILGTKNAIEASIDAHVQKFVLISTDKAVRSTNVMGATKRVCEMIAQNIRQKYPESKTDIVAVRFGNVIGSSGSVIPKFKEQLLHGGPLTVTHPDIERYFMLISEACELVLQAASIAKGGEVFILDMGERVKILDVAKKMIELSGRANEVEIVFTGLRPGEKLIEELLTADSAVSTKYESITVAKEEMQPYAMIEEKIARMLEASDKLSVLKELVPDFHHAPHGENAHV